MKKTKIVKFLHFIQIYPSEMKLQQGAKSAVYIARSGTQAMSNESATSFPIGIILILCSFLFASCMTTAQKEALQMNINQLDAEVNKLHERIAAQLKQMERTTRVTLTSQSDLQNTQAQLQENLGEIDAIKVRLKKIEDISSANSERYVAKINANEQMIIKLQRQIARLELSMSETSGTSANAGTSPAHKTIAKFKNATELSKLLKKEYERGNFREVVQYANIVLQSRQSDSVMLEVALEFRGEAKFQLSDYRGAAIDLSNYVEDYPNGEKLPRALLLLGDSYVYLKNQTVAMSYYSDCISAYTNSPEGAACAARVNH